MKLLFCIKAMNNPGGGAEKVLASITSGLAGLGHQITILSYDQPGGQSYYPLDDKIERIELGIGSTTDRATVCETLQRVHALRRCVREYAPDVAIGFMHSMFIPLGFALIGTSIPIIASEHIVPKHYLSRPLQALLLLLSPYITNRITCVSEQVFASYPPSLRQNMIVVPNPVSIQIKGRADVLGSQNSHKILLSVGRLTSQKDHATLIAAFAKIADQEPDWHLRIVGHGNLRRKLETMISELGLTGRIQLAGTIKDIGAEYLSAQLFVIASRYESFGLATAEALNYGLPAVGFDDCAGINQLICPGINGDLADSNGDRVTTLATTLLKLMKNDALRVQLAPQTRTLSSKHHPKHVYDQWELLCEATKGEFKREVQRFD